jgi:hypothetical protein
MSGIRTMNVDDALQQAVSQNTREEPSAFVSRRISNESVRSVQRLPAIPGKDALWTAKEYVKWLPKAFLPLIQVRLNGNTCAFFLTGIRKPLLILELSEERSTSDRALFYIQGGLLAKLGKHRGRFEFREVNNEEEILAALHDFYPKLPWIVYRFTQAPGHRLVMSLFSSHLQKIKKLTD